MNSFTHVGEGLLAVVIVALVLVIPRLAKEGWRNPTVRRTRSDRPRISVKRLWPRQRPAGEIDDPVAVVPQLPEEVPPEPVHPAATAATATSSATARWWAEPEEPDEPEEDWGVGSRTAVLPDAEADDGIGVHSLSITPEPEEPDDLEADTVRNPGGAWQRREADQRIQDLGSELYNLLMRADTDVTHPLTEAELNRADRVSPPSRSGGVVMPLMQKRYEEQLAGPGALGAQARARTLLVSRKIQQVMFELYGDQLLVKGRELTLKASSLLCAVAESKEVRVQVANLIDRLATDDSAYQALLQIFLDA